jgi:hypothetical protein
MSLRALIEVCPPPARPKFASGDWTRVTSVLGPIPSDYRQLIERYGSGAFARRVTIFNPFDPNPYVELVASAMRALEADRATRHEFPDDFQFPLYPEPGGILPWAVTDAGDTLYWMEAGPPDAWPIVVIMARELAGETFDVCTTAFLAGWIAGTIKPAGMRTPKYREFVPA